MFFSNVFQRVFFFFQKCISECFLVTSDSYDPMDCSPQGSSVHGILQARILEWAAMLSPGDLPDPGIKPVSPVTPALQADSLPLATGEALNTAFF